MVNVNAMQRRSRNYKYFQIFKIRIFQLAILFLNFLISNAAT